MKVMFWQISKFAPLSGTIVPVEILQDMEMIKSRAL
jgi:hypothetical protein